MNQNNQLANRRVFTHSGRGGSPSTETMPKPPIRFRPSHIGVHFQTWWCLPACFAAAAGSRASQPFGHRARWFSPGRT